MSPDDLTPYLGGAEIPADYDAQGAIDAAVAELEALTGRSPFLSTGSESETAFDPPSGASGRWILDLPGYTAISSIAWGSDTETVWYTLPGQSRPIDAVEFRYGGVTDMRSVVVTGVRGSYAAYPADVRAAILKRAAASIIETSIGVQGAVRKRDIGDRSIEYAVSQADGAISNLATTYRRDFLATVSRYRRIPRNG